MKKTFFIDIDGCLIKHKGNLSTQIIEEVELLPGVIEKLNLWESEGHKIILTTGRKESMRELTMVQLQRVGIFYDQLVMGCNRGERIIINDKKVDNDICVCSAIEIDRNTGMKNIKI